MIEIGKVYLKTIYDYGMKMDIPHSYNFANAMYGFRELGAEIIPYHVLDEVYVAYKKAIKPQSYNSWVNSVIDEGDGKFIIVMDVKMPDSDEPVNINLPVERNEDGKFVFTDYPYWDKSE